MLANGGSSARGGSLYTVDYGQVRIAGSFCGSVTTSSHHLEVSLPLDLEVTSDVCRPFLLAALRSRSTSGSEETPRSSSHGVWAQLLDIVCPFLTARSSQSHSQSSCGTCCSDRRLQEKDQQPAPSVDDAVAALRALTLERDALLAEMEALRRRLEAGPLQEQAGQARRGDDAGSSQVLPAAIIRSEAPEDRSEVPTAAGSRKESCMLRLEGSFSGHAIFGQTLLDVVLPISGPIPADAALLASRALAEAVSASQCSKEHAKTPKRPHQDNAAAVWIELVRLLSAEFPAAAQAVNDQAHAAHFFIGDDDPSGLGSCPPPSPWTTDLLSTSLDLGSGSNNAVGTQLARAGSRSLRAAPATLAEEGSEEAGKQSSLTAASSPSGQVTGGAACSLAIQAASKSSASAASCWQFDTVAVPPTPRPACSGCPRLRDQIETLRVKNATMSACLKHAEEAALHLAEAFRKQAKAAQTRQLTCASSRKLSLLHGASDHRHSLDLHTPALGRGLTASSSCGLVK
eukprot:TRINITY_DN59591_c0_g1_i1.p1 TRINITY_DN59591_c0_g1~~TRINITY_DN59591_c0_g1_i1.p1  ORF type:complete len:515 (-),score=118.20 TRINITY_DN59591_c0_g1_i1:3-1547(-)